MLLGITKSTGGLLDIGLAGRFFLPGLVLDLASSIKIGQDLPSPEVIQTQPRVIGVAPNVDSSSMKFAMEASLVAVSVQLTTLLVTVPAVKNDWTGSTTSTSLLVTSSVLTRPNLPAGKGWNGSSRQKNNGRACIVASPMMKSTASGISRLAGQIQNT